MQDKPLILITRIKEDSERFRSLLGSAKADIHIQPFFDVNMLTPPLENADDVDGLLITSQHAIAYLKHHAILKSKPCVVVGKHTRECLRKAGFKNITHCANSAAMMRDYLVGKTQPERLLYPRGGDISFDFKAAMKDSPIQLSEIITYEVAHIEPDMQKLAALLTPKTTIILPLFSVQTAQFVCESLLQLGEEIFQKSIAVPMSTAIADAIGNYSWKKIAPSRSAGLQSVAKMVMLSAEP